MVHRSSLALALALAGCFTSKTAEPAKPAQPLVAAPAHPDDHLARVVADPLGFLPVDAEVVMHFDAERMRRSAIWQKYESTILAAVGPKLQQLKDTCGIDPIAQLATVRAGFKNLGQGDHPQGVFVVTGLDNERIRACIPANKSESNITVDGDVILGSSSDGQKFAIELVDRSALVAVFGEGADRAALDEVLHAGTPLRTSAAFADMFRAIDTHSALWFVMNGSAKVFDQAAALGFRPRAVLASVGLVDGMSVSARLRFDAPATATQMSTMLGNQAGIVKSFVEHLDITTDANDVVIEVGMTDAQLASIFGALGLFVTPPPPPPAPVSP